MGFSWKEISRDLKQSFPIWTCQRLILPKIVYAKLLDLEYPRVKAYGQTRDHKKKRKKRETLAFETWEKLKRKSRFTFHPLNRYLRDQ